jgi:hypothetical protein
MPSSPAGATHHLPELDVWPSFKQGEQSGPVCGRKAAAWMAIKMAGDRRMKASGSRVRSDHSMTGRKPWGEGCWLHPLACRVCAHQTLLGQMEGTKAGTRVTCLIKVLTKIQFFEEVNGEASLERMPRSVTGARLSKEPMPRGNPAGGLEGPQQPWKRLLPALSLQSCDFSSPFPCYSTRHVEFPPHPPKTTTQKPRAPGSP